MDLPYTEILPGMPAFTEISTKWILNAISTGANVIFCLVFLLFKYCFIGGFVLQGKVFQNRMIDLGITNHKLFHRACGIVTKFGSVDLPTATLNVLRAIYSLDPDDIVPDDLLNAPISDHVRRVNQGIYFIISSLYLCYFASHPTLRRSTEGVHKNSCYCPTFVHWQVQHIYSKASVGCRPYCT